MKAEDLMVGDWVNVFDSPKQIEGIRKFKNGDEIVYYDGDNGNFLKAVTPIPLTSEILEKNGFVFSHDIFDGIYPMVNIIYCDYKLLADDGKYINGGENNNIKYVHELQHALKLCGIEKEIVL